VKAFVVLSGGGIDRELAALVPLLAIRARWLRILNGESEDDESDVDRRHAGVGQSILLLTDGSRKTAARRPSRNVARPVDGREEQRLAVRAGDGDAIT
jgi:hypothetical protein